MSRTVKQLRDLLTSDSLRVSIIGGTIAALAVIFLFEPILNTTGRLIAGLASNVWEGYLDRWVESAALGHRNHIVVFVEWLIYSAFVGFIGGIGQRGYSKLMKARHQAFGEGEPESEPETDLQRYKRQKRRLVTLGVLGAVVVLGGLSTMASDFANLQLWTSFQQRMTVLEPALSEQEEEQLRAQWAKMKIKEDYDAIQRALERQAADAGITLPDPLIEI